MTIPHEVRIKISWGLILLAAIAGAVSGAMVLTAVMFGHSKPDPKPEFQWHPRPAESPYMGESVQSFSPLQQPPPGVDMDAQTELKQAGGCLPCQLPQRQPQYVNPQQPTYINGERVTGWGPTHTVPQSTTADRDDCGTLAAKYNANVIEVSDFITGQRAVSARLRDKTTVWKSSGSDETVPVQAATIWEARKLCADLMRAGIARRGSATPQPSQPLLMPAPGGQLTMPAVRNVSNTVDRPEGKQFQTLLFVDQSYQGQQLKSWFETDPALVRLRNGTDFQIFTPENLLYQERFASTMPKSEFPAIIVQDSTGGHLYAVGGSYLPHTADAMWSDIQLSYKNYKQAKSGLMQVTGAIKTRGYNWDATMNPAMQLAPQDCPDGICPLPTDEQAWRPGDVLRPNNGGGLFDGSGVPRSWFAWGNATELITAGVMAICLFLIVAIFIVLILRNRS